MSETYNVYMGTSPGSLVLAALGVAATSVVVPGVPLAYGTTYYWRVDAVNEYGITTGDVWSFTTLSYDPPLSRWKSLPGKTLGPLTGGVEGVDFYYTGENFANRMGRLVVASDDAIWYEAVDS